MNEDLSQLDPNVQWIIAEARRPVSLNPAARQQLLDTIATQPTPRRSGRFATWLASPRAVVLSPVASIAIAAGLVGIGVILGNVYHRDGRAPIEQPRAVAAVPQLPDSVAARVVKFVLIAPQAKRVTLVGDFNGWNQNANAAVRGTDGSWTTFVSLVPGRHVYSFVIDGMHFVTDPAAPIAPDDGFGQQNSVVLVRGASS